VGQGWANWTKISEFVEPEKEICLRNLEVIAEAFDMTISQLMALYLNQRVMIVDSINLAVLTVVNQQRRFLRGKDMPVRIFRSAEILHSSINRSLFLNL